MGEKSHTYITRELAQSTAKASYKNVMAEINRRNEEDPDLNESATLVTDEVNKRFTLTRPDIIDGVQVVHYCWE